MSTIIRSYDLSAAQEAILEKSFMQVPPKDGQAERYEKVNQALAQAARKLCQITPNSAEQMLAIRALQEAKFWFNEAIAKNEV